MACNNNEFFEVVHRKPTGPAYKLGDSWLVVHRPIEDWPEPLRARYGHHVRRCLRSQSGSKEGCPGDIAICFHSSCRRKSAGQEDPTCPEYLAGICCEATLRANQAPLSSEAIRRICGLSPEAMQKALKYEIERLMQSVLQDPILCEMIEHVGINSSQYLAAA